MNHARKIMKNQIPSITMQWGSLKLDSKVYILGKINKSLFADI